MDATDLGHRSEVDSLTSRLDAVADDLRDMWSAAVTEREFDEVTRLVEASHAVHRAVVALRADHLIATGPQGDQEPGQR